MVLQHSKPFMVAETVYHEKKRNTFGILKKERKRVRKEKEKKKERNPELTNRRFYKVKAKKALPLGILHNIKRQTKLGPLALWDQSCQTIYLQSLVISISHNSFA